MSNATIMNFIKKWEEQKGHEDADDKVFWIEFLQQVLNVKNATNRICFQKKVIINGHTKKIDAYIPETKVLIEQKSHDIPLDKKLLQSDGEWLTAYEQAKRYNDNLPFSEKARWIITSNFSEFWIYDMEAIVPEQNLKRINLFDIKKVHSKLSFILNDNQFINDINLQGAHLKRGMITVSIEFVDCLLSHCYGYNKKMLEPQRLFMLVLQKIAEKQFDCEATDVVELNINEVIDLGLITIPSTPKRRLKFSAKDAILNYLNSICIETKASLSNLRTMDAHRVSFASSIYINENIITIKLSEVARMHISRRYLTLKRVSHVSFFPEDIIKFKQAASMSLYFALLKQVFRENHAKENGTLVISEDYLKDLYLISDDDFDRARLPYEIAYFFGDVNNGQMLMLTPFTPQDFCRKIKQGKSFNYEFYYSLFADESEYY